VEKRFRGTIIFVQRHLPPEEADGQCLTLHGAVSGMSFFLKGGIAQSGISIFSKTAADRLK
jgi:hypothetical protein